MQPDQQNSYDFIMNPEQNKSSGPVLGGPQKLLAIVGLFAVVIVIIMILFSIVFSNSAGNRNNLISASAHQIELSRVIDLGIDDVVDQRLKQQFQTLLTTSTSDNQEITAIIAIRGFEVEPLELKAQQDKTIDTEFEDAKNKNDFDPVFEDAVTKAASQYVQSLQTALGSASTQQEQTALDTAIKNVQAVAQPPSSNPAE